MGGFHTRLILFALHQIASCTGPGHLVHQVKSSIDSAYGIVPAQTGIRMEALFHQVNMCIDGMLILRIVCRQGVIQGLGKATGEGPKFNSIFLKQQILLVKTCLDGFFGDVDVQALQRRGRIIDQSADRAMGGNTDF